jgi:hypothetical protein
VTDGKVKKTERDGAKPLGTIAVKRSHESFTPVEKLVGNDDIEAIRIVSEKAVKGRSITHNIE